MMEKFFFGRPGDAAVVYVMESDYGVKVGVAGLLARDSRLLAIRAASGLPVEMLRSYAFRDRAHAFAVEREAHQRLAESRRHGEWFQCHPLEALAVLDRLYADERMAAA